MMGSTLKTTYCRLCLCEIPDETSITFINGFQKEMMEVILPELNFTICSQALMCRLCTDTLKQLYAFKSSCLEVEDKIQAFANPKTTPFIDLKEVVRKTARHKISGNLSVCRTCLTLSQESNLSKLGSCEGDPLQNMVEKCFPEMGLNLTEEPSICSNCLEQLEELFSFIMQCLDTESKIHYYCETKHIFRNIDLHNVHLFSLKMEESGDYGKQYDDVAAVDEISEHGAEKRTPHNIKTTLSSLKPAIFVDLTDDGSPVNNKPAKIDAVAPIKNKREPIEEVSFQMGRNQNGEEIITSETSRIIRDDDSDGSVTNESDLLTVKKVVSTRSSPRRNSVTAIKGNGVHRKKWEYKDDDYQSEEEGWEKKKRLITQKCKHCPFKTKYRSRMKAHMTRSHKAEAEEERRTRVKALRCAQCPFKTEHEREFQKHKVGHRKERQGCPRCDATFARQDFLNKHLATHESRPVKTARVPKTVVAVKPSGAKEKPPLAITSVMSRPRSSRTFLMNGMAFKMFRCGYCPYQTRLKSNYHKHVSTHKTGSSGIKVNKCDVCGFETIHKENYLTHMEGHKNDDVDKVRRCFLCSFQPNTEQELAVHVGKVHKSGGG